MEENTQLPKEVVQSLKAAVKRRSLSKDYADGYKEGYTAGATAYATKLHQANETIKVLTYNNEKLKGEVEGLKEAHEDHQRLVRHLDILINGDAAAEQASLCDLVKQIGSFGLPAVKNKNYKGGVWVKAKVFRYEEYIEYYYKYEYLGKTIKGLGMYDKYGFFRLLPSRGLPPVGLDKVYILDESPTATFNPELLQVMQDAEKSKEDDLKAVKEVIGGEVAGREEAVEFAEWCANNYSWEFDPASDECQWLEANNFYTTAELYELFKQQKEK